VVSLCLGAVFLTHSNGANVVKEKGTFTPLSGWRFLTRLDHWVGGVFQRKPQFLLFEVHFRMCPISKSNNATPPHAACFQTVRGMRQPGIIKFTKMRMRLSVWEFRTGSKFGGGLPVPKSSKTLQAENPSNPPGLAAKI